MKTTQEILQEAKAIIDSAPINIMNQGKPNELLVMNMLHLQIMAGAIMQGLTKDKMYKVTAPWPNRDCLMIAQGSGRFANLGELHYYSVVYGEHTSDYATDNSPDAYFAVNTQYYPIERLGEAIGCFIQRLQSLMAEGDCILCEEPKSYTLDQIAAIEKGETL